MSVKTTDFFIRTLRRTPSARRIRLPSSSQKSASRVNASRPCADVDGSPGARMTGGLGVVDVLQRFVGRESSTMGQWWRQERERPRNDNKGSSVTRLRPVGMTNQSCAVTLRVHTYKPRPESDSLTRSSSPAGLYRSTYARNTLLEEGMYQDGTIEHLLDLDSRCRRRSVSNIS